MRRSRLLATGIAVMAAVGLSLGLAPGPQLEVTAPLAFRGHDRVVELPDYGKHGTTAVGYSDRRSARVDLPVRNVGRSTVTVRGLEPFPELLGLVEAVHGADLPLAIAPGEVATLHARVRFTNCEYYTERAVNRFRAAHVQVERFGLAQTVEFGVSAGGRVALADHPRLSRSLDRPQRAPTDARARRVTPERLRHARAVLALRRSGAV